MATVKFFIRGTSNLQTIYADLNYGQGKRQKTSTGLKIDKSQWNAKKSMPTQNKEKHRAELISTLKNLQSFIIDKYQHADELIPLDFLKDTIAQFFDNKGKKHPRGVLSKTPQDTFIFYIKEYIKNASTKSNKTGGVGLSKKSLLNYKTLLSNVLDYQNTHHAGKTLYLSQITTKQIETFKKMLLDKGISSSSCRVLIMYFKSICRYIHKMGKSVPADLSAIDLPQYKKLEEQIQAQVLTFSDLDKIEQADLPQYLQDSRSWLLLGCEIGQRASDLLNLTQEHFIETPQGRAITLRQQKTGKKVILPITQRAKRILKNGLPKKICYVKFNKDIKEICRLSGLTELCVKSKYLNFGALEQVPKYEAISTHSCRRSFASNYYGKIPTNLLKQATGHSTEAMLLKYIGKDQDQIINEMMNAFKNF